MANKILTYSRYFIEYLKFKDIISIVASINYIINKKSHKHDRIIKSSIGKFYCRSGTNDFQYANYYYEWGVKKYILDKLDKFDVFVDAGACVGDYSILLAKKGKRCFAFEALTDNFEILKKNVELNNLSGQIKYFPYGLGECDGHVKFEMSSINTGSSKKINNESLSEQYNYREATIKSLDSMLPDLNIEKKDRVLFKLDVEGMESEVLRGAVNFLNNTENVVLILEDKLSGKSQIVETLNKIGKFKIGKVDEHNIYAIKEY